MTLTVSEMIRKLLSEKKLDNLSKTLSDSISGIMFTLSFKKEMDVSRVDLILLRKFEYSLAIFIICAEKSTRTPNTMTSTENKVNEMANILDIPFLTSHFTTGYKIKANNVAKQIGTKMGFPNHKMAVIAIKDAST